MSLNMASVLTIDFLKVVRLVFWSEQVYTNDSSIIADTKRHLRLKTNEKKLKQAIKVYKDIKNIS